MKKFLPLLFIISLLIFNCSEDTQEILSPIHQTGKIELNITWPENINFSKTTSGIDKITAYIYKSGKEITHKDLIHEGDRGKAEITVPVANDYRLELIAKESWFDFIVYVGYKEYIDIIADETTVVDITMVSAAPTLHSAEITGENSFNISWNSVSLATSYILEENTSGEFYSNEEGLLPSVKTVYAGPDTTVTIANKATGIYYYIVFAVTPYDNRNYTGGIDPEFDIYIALEFGATSEIRMVQVGSTGSLSIDIPWPGE